MLFRSKSRAVKLKQLRVTFGINAKHLAGGRYDMAGCFLKAVLISASLGVFKISSYPCIGIGTDCVVSTESVPDVVGVMRHRDGVVG